MICKLLSYFKCSAFIHEIFGCSDPVPLQRFRFARFLIVAAGWLTLLSDPPNIVVLSLAILNILFTVFYFMALLKFHSNISKVSRVAQWCLYAVYFVITVVFGGLALNLFNIALN